MPRPRPAPAARARADAARHPPLQLAAAHDRSLAGVTFAEPDGPPPQVNLDVLKPGPLPQLSFEGWEKPAVAKPEFKALGKPTFQAPPTITLVKPQMPNITVTKTAAPQKNFTIRPPEKVNGNITVVKSSYATNVSRAVNVSKPAYNVNVTIVKGKKPDVKPYWEKPSADVSITKFEETRAYNFTYLKPATNFSVTLLKPGKPHWLKGDDGELTKEEETKGVTINGTLTPPVMVGPVDDIIGQRLVCEFPKGTAQDVLAIAKKVPAGLAPTLASKDPNSFVAPPYGVRVFGPGCMTYDWACRSNLGVPCSGHGVCQSSRPNSCVCFAGYTTCLPAGMSNGVNGWGGAREAEGARGGRPPCADPRTPPSLPPHHSAKPTCTTTPRIAAAAGTTTRRRPPSPSSCAQMALSAAAWPAACRRPTVPPRPRPTRRRGRRASSRRRSTRCAARTRFCLRRSRPRRRATLGRSARLPCRRRRSSRATRRLGPWPRATRRPGLWPRATRRLGLWPRATRRTPARRRRLRRRRTAGR